MYAAWKITERTALKLNGIIFISQLPELLPTTNVLAIYLGYI